MSRLVQSEITLAKIKKIIAKAERKLASCCKKEMVVLQKLYLIEEDFTGRHLTQANINIKRVQYYHKHTYERPRVVKQPANIITSLSKLSVPLVYDIVV